MKRELDQAARSENAGEFHYDSQFDQKDNRPIDDLGDVDEFRMFGEVIAFDVPKMSSIAISHFLGD